jgi:hypothetical protein
MGDGLVPQGHHSLHSSVVGLIVSREFILQIVYDLNKTHEGYFSLN